MSNARTFEVTITPLEPYYFGGEKTFFKEPDSNESQEYYVRSNVYPQQTALLGAMRYVLLEQNGLLPIHSFKREATALIGATSFDFSQTGQTFGVIKELSPIFFKNSEGWLRETERDNDISLIDRAGSVSLIAGRGAKETKTNLLKGYNVKDGIAKSWVNSNGKVFDNRSKQQIIFRHTEQVGIQKNKGEGDQESFYKQVYIKLENDFSFVFQITLHENVPFVFVPNGPDQKQIRFADALFTMGGERSPFRLQVKDLERQDINYQDIIRAPQRSNAPKLTLLSDAIMDLDGLNRSKFVLAETVDFRQLRTSVEKTESYSRRSLYEKEKYVERSEKYKLLEKGGVLFFNNNEELRAIAQKLEEHPAYKIGFNHYLTILTN